MQYKNIDPISFVDIQQKPIDLFEPAVSYKAYMLGIINKKGTTRAVDASETIRYALLGHMP